MPKIARRFGIGEWYGRNFASLSPDTRKDFGKMQFKKNVEVPLCPFLSNAERQVKCWKKGGVCSLRLYERKADGDVVPAPETGLRCVCPSRFEENSTIYSWIGEVLLGNANSVAVGQVNFLERMPLMRERAHLEGKQIKAEEVGRIDNILIVPRSNPLRWCPVEVQAVYFSGQKMELEFNRLKTISGDKIPFPAGKRRPDYRSSGPKRLMPQLLVKVPTLSRWGKKMAVVVDEDFFAELGKMEEAPDVSNCDVAWFIVGFIDNGDRFNLCRKEFFLTTLDSSRSGLVAAKPVSQQEFERRIEAKLSTTTAPSRDSSR